MSFLGGLFGGDSGAGYQAEGVAGLPGAQTLATPEQLAQAAQQSQSSLGAQSEFVNALRNQGGIQNQSAAFNSLVGLQGQQQWLANQLQDESLGGGPNPAAAQLAQNTGQNVQQQAALMNSMRGGGGNVGLMAGQAAQQGGAIQQQAAGQAAIMRANQQLAAQQQMAMQQQAMGNTIGNQGNLATQQVGQFNNALGTQNQMAQNRENMLLGSAQAQNAQNVALRSNMNSANAGIAGQNAGFQAGLVNNGISGLAGIFGKSGSGGGGGGSGGGSSTNSMPDTGTGSGRDSSNTPMAHGGVVGYAGGGAVPSSILGQYSQGFEGTRGINPNEGLQNVQLNMPQPTNSGGGGGGLGGLIGGGIGAIGGLLGSIGGKKGTDQGSLGTNPDANSTTSDSGSGMGTSVGGGGYGGTNESKGGKIKGKAKVKGDSEKNDTVPAKLSPGEIVIPRSHVNDPKKIAEFLNHLTGFHLRAV